MKYLKLFFLFTLCSSTLNGQKDYSNDVSSLDQIITSLYEVISGDAGVERDWDRFRHLFVDEARLIPSFKNQEGKMGYRIWTPDQYIELAGSNVEEKGFFEKEINRKTEKYGSLVHVWSTYESFRSSTEMTPFARGINSIQLMNDGNRWWIMQIYWLGETEDNPLPEYYLKD